MAEKTVTKIENAPAAAHEQRLPGTREEQRYQVPPVDIFETRDGLTVVADLPGVDKDGVEVRVNDGVLSIQGRVHPVPQGDGMYNEFMLLDYFRQFELNDQVDQEKISAEMKHGVLTINLPRTPETKPKQIEVRVL